MFTSVNRQVAVLDACVLAPMPVCDTLLRIAEAGFYAPKWSHDILAEVSSTLTQKLGYSPEQIAYRISQMNLIFEDAQVFGYESLIPAMGNHPKDRHVLAAAVRCNADTIVTDNLKDFPAVALDPFKLTAQGCDDFLTHQYHLSPDLFINILESQAADIGRSLPALLLRLSVHTPKLASLIKA